MKDSRRRLYRPHSRRRRQRDRSARRRKILAPHLQDLRHDAEKAKAPALVHKDLDLVQRILRDQLSEDFTAIRIDSEEEYQRVVEFVNRMQPRLIKRVKLYTRDEPISKPMASRPRSTKRSSRASGCVPAAIWSSTRLKRWYRSTSTPANSWAAAATRLEDTITRTNLEAVERLRVRFACAIWAASSCST